MEIQIRQKQLDDIEKFYDLIKSESGIIETFFVKPDKTKATRFYEDKQKFITDVVAFNHKGFTCYAGLQPRNRELLKGNRSGTNKDVHALRLLYADIDPVRPSKVNATDIEKGLCLNRAIDIQKKLQNGNGYNKPSLTSSGNGCWLLARISEIIITEDNRSEISVRLKQWGAELAEKFSDEDIKIDRNTFDLRRITKIPGTRTYNYPDTPDRPQGIAEILSDHEPTPDEKLREDFLSLEVDVSKTLSSNTDYLKPHNPDRIFERCYTIRFFKDKGDRGINLPHPVRLALSGFSLALGDLKNDLHFIRQIIGGCPDFDENKTRYYLKMNKGKSIPYGCQKMKALAEEHFTDFEPEKCNCTLTPSFNPETNQYRKPSPIRFGYLIEDDLHDLFDELEFSEDKFINYTQLKEFTNKCLTSFDQGTSKAFLESKKKELKLRVEDIKYLLNYRQQSIDLSTSKEAQPELSEEDKQRAIKILKRPSLLYDYGKFIQRLGVVGEDKNIRIIILSLTSRIMPNIISLVIKAESSAGKSHLLKNCLNRFPEEFYYEFTSMSNRAMIYTDKEFEHKFIIFYEFDGQNDDINYLIRTLQSEGRLKYEYTAKMDGDFVTHTIDKEGPTGFITTTTKSQIFDENETRIFSLHINESNEQTKNIVKKLGDDYCHDDRDIPSEAIEDWKNIQRILKPYKVVIPYAGWLADNVPTDKVRIRRDFGRILIAISVCALLHQYQREHIQKDDCEYIQASVADYLIVRELFEGSLNKSVHGTSPKTETLVNVLKKIYANKTKNISSEDKETDHLVSIAELINETRASRKTIYNWMNPALDNGDVEKISIGRRIFFKPLDKHNRGIFTESSFLPEPGKLLNAFPEISSDLRFVHPVTGEEMIVEDDGKEPV